MDSLNIWNCFEKANEMCCLVVGDIILDKYMYGRVERISPEAPIPVVIAEKEKYVLGGAANVAGNIRGYHVNVYLCGLLGQDDASMEVQNLLEKKNIKFAGYCSDRRCTTVKTRVMGTNQQLIRIDQERNMKLDAHEEKYLLKKASEVLEDVQIVVLSDYNKGVCSSSFCKKIMLMCRKKGKNVIVDPKSSNWEKYEGAWLITPNFKEFQEAVGDFCENTESSIKENGQMLMERYGIPQLLVTRSQYGMVFVKQEGVFSAFQSIEQEVYDVSGAGDTVVATIAAGLAVGMPVENAVELSNYGAGLAVSKSGTYMVTLEELMLYANHFSLWYEDKIWSKDRLQYMLKLWKNQRVVFTNGCFDVLHVGHVNYLNQARKMGDKLIVGLNTDNSVRRLKGGFRPVNDQKSRALLLAALQCVDAVVLFDEDTPEELIKAVRPDCLVKGGDYRPEDVAGKQYAGKVCIIPLTTGFSTTGFLEKLRKNYDMEIQDVTQ